MKLAVKVALALMCTVLSVLAPFAYVRIEREIALFDSDMRKDHTLVGTTLAVSVGDVLAREGIGRADELVRLTNDSRAGTLVRWKPAEYWTDVEERPRWAHLTAPTHEVVAASPESPDAAPDADSATFLRSYFPVIHGGRTVGVVELSTSHEQRDRYVQASTFNAVLATTLTVAASAAVMLILGMWLIARPMEALVDKARRVGASDLSGPLELVQNDEIGMLAREMNLMCDQLADARQTATLEVAAREQALEQLRHAERLITVGKLAAGVAHELGTPLNIILGRARMIVRKKVTGETILDYAQSIAEQADRMTRIILQLLDFSRRRGPKLERVDLALVTKNAASLLTHLAEKRGVQLLIEAGPSVHATVDPSQIQQVVTNLVLNALQACPTGATATVSVSHATAGPNADEQTSWVRLRVADTGCGMTPDVKRHIFEPFFTTKDVGQGSGLGLSVVHGIVEEHHGRIVVDSEPHRGTTMSVYLPLEA